MKALEQSLSYLRSFLEFRMDQAPIPGAVVTVARQGEIIFSQAFGWANIERKEKMTVGHSFRAASHSKMYAATCVALLMEQGELKYSQKASRFLPELKEGKDARLQNVTIAQLLSHTSGVVRDGYSDDFWALDVDFPDRKQLLREILQNQLPIAPGSKMKYSNFGYGLLGLLIEAISGESYAKFLSDQVLRPLGLRNTAADLPERPKGKVVTGYTGILGGKGRRSIVDFDTHALAAATGICTTGEDLCRFLWAHSNANSVLLKKATRKEMQTARRAIIGGAPGAEYGLGFTIERVSGRRLVGHGGGFTGQISYTMMDPKDGLTVSVLTNTIESHAMPIGNGIFHLLDFFAKKKKPELPNKKTAQFTGRWSNIWLVLDFIPLGGGRVAMVSPTQGWDAFASPPAELRVVNNKNLQISVMGSMGSLGEEVHFRTGRSGRGGSVQLGSNHLLPHAAAVRKLQAKKQIG